MGGLRELCQGLTFWRDNSLGAAPAPGPAHRTTSWPTQVVGKGGGWLTVHARTRARALLEDPLASTGAPIEASLQP